MGSQEVMHLGKQGFSEILPSEIDYYGQEVGKGSFGKVIEGRCRGKNVVIKTLKCPINDENSLAEFKKEVEIMSTIFHPNICLFMGACTIPGHLFIVSEFLPGGNVEELLRNSRVELPLYQRIKMAKDAALGINWLHCNKPNVIHRDLKTSNLLLDENGRVKVCDFGLSQFKNPGETLRDSKNAKGTPLWMAPEIMQFKTFDEKSDVYSFGIILWELLTRQKPFAHHKDYQMFRFAVCKQGERPQMPANVEPRLKDLIERCWSTNPNKRPSTSEILKELDVILINVAIEDSYGRLFWMKKFLSNEKLCEVPWDVFASGLLSFLCIRVSNKLEMENMINLKCLKVLLLGANKNSQMVNISEFGRILKWFGPITSQDQMGNTFLDKIRSIMINPWFHGDIDKTVAETRLIGKKHHTFLIRFSSIEGHFTISILASDNSIKHQRIEYNESNEYTIKNHHYKSLQELVARECLTLKYPCSGSSYQNLFKDIEQFGYTDSLK